MAPSYEEGGFALAWSDETVAPGARRGTARVVVTARPAHPANAMRALYRIDGGPELSARGHAIGAPDPDGAQRFAIDLPAGPGAVVAWRPILSRSGREIDPWRGGLPPGILRTAAPDPAAPDPAALDRAAPRTDGPARFPHAFRFLARVTAPLERHPHVVGDAPDGLHIVFPIGEGGAVRGPGLQGDVAHVGGDWMRLRSDGVGEMAVRALIRTPDGALLQSEYGGVVDFGADGHERIRSGRWPARASVEGAPRYITASPRWRWLNRLQCVAIGRVTMSTLLVEYDLYALRSGAAEAPEGARDAR